MSSETSKPEPHPTPVSQPYWDAAREGRLVLQHCAACHRPRHYPQPVCPHCHALACEWIEASGRGTVHSWTVAHHAVHPAFKGELPYTLVIVDLAEGPRMLGRFETAADVLRLGLPVSLRFDDAGLPIFAAA
jgi:uncharacterized OB-fold protein